MREFFKGWRRKAGCVLLVLAAAAATAWCRSLTVRDQFDHVSSRFEHVNGMTIRQITSDSGILCWATIDHFEDFLDSSVPESGWSSRPASETGPIGYGGLCQWRLAWGGFEFAKGTFGRARIFTWAVPYWSLAIPLTLLSAYLLLPTPKELRNAAQGCRASRLPWEHCTEERLP